MEKKNNVRMFRGNGTSQGVSVDTSNIFIAKIVKFNGGVYNPSSAQVYQTLGKGTLLHPAVTIDFKVMQGNKAPYVAFIRRSWKTVKSAGYTRKNVEMRDSIKFKAGFYSAIRKMWSGEIENKDWRPNFDFNTVPEQIVNVLSLRPRNEQSAGQYGIVGNMNVELDFGYLNDLVVYDRGTNDEIVEPQGFIDGIEYADEVVEGAETIGGAESSTGKPGDYKRCYTMTDVACKYLLDVIKDDIAVEETSANVEVEEEVTEEDSVAIS